MKDEVLEIVCVDPWFEDVISLVFLVFLCVIVYAFTMNLRALIRSEWAGRESTILRWRLQLSLAVTCIAGMLTVLVAFQAVILVLFMFRTQV